MFFNCQGELTVYVHVLLVLWIRNLYIYRDMVTECKNFIIFHIAKYVWITIKKDMTEL